MAYTDEQRYWIWLASIHGLGVRRFDLLLEACGNPRAVWDNYGAWMEPLLGAQAYGALGKARSDAYVEQLFESMAACGATAVTRVDPEYPARLRAIADAPAVLYVRGRVALEDTHTLAVVGARNCTAYGTRMARQIARELSRDGVTVVSGLARGVDSAAHRGAVDSKARTVAVLGSGVDVVYPPEHRMLAEEILQNGGSIVSELLPGTSPKPQHFPARNRIISGMSEGLLLVEGAKKSGAMGTVAYALEQGREVFALPGQADNPLSSSPHALIRDGARLVTCAQDILRDMGWRTRAELAQAQPHRVAQVLPLTQTEQKVYNLLAGGPMDTDALVEATGIPAAELNALLTILELQGVIQTLPGRRVERLMPEG